MTQLNDTGFTFVGRNITPILLTALMGILVLLFNQTNSKISDMSDRINQQTNHIAQMRTDVRLIEERMATKQVVYNLERRVDRVEMMLGDERE